MVAVAAVLASPTLQTLPALLSCPPFRFLCEGGIAATTDDEAALDCFE